jgi:hypothetical protein
LEQQLITIDNLLDEENVDPFMDDEIEAMMTLSIDEMSKSQHSNDLLIMLSGNSYEQSKFQIFWY